MYRPGVTGERNGGSQWSDELSAAWERHRQRLFEAQRATSDWLVDRLAPRPGETVLELAAGPGETGFVVAEMVGLTGRVISTDVGEGMVAAAQRGVAARGLTNVECRLMDAQESDLDDGSVDAVLCRFGVMLMPDQPRVLAEAHRVLRPGGRLAYAVWGMPDTNPWLFVLAAAIGESGHQIPGNPFEPGGVFSLAEPERNRELVGGAGFDEIAVEEIPSAYEFDSFDEYWDLNTEVSGPIALLIASLSDDDVRAVKERARQKADPFRSGDGYTFPSLALGVYGARVS